LVEKRIEEEQPMKDDEFLDILGALLIGIFVAWAAFTVIIRL